MAGINKAILVGNLGADPDAHYTPGGLVVVNLSLATSEVRTNKAGDKETRTEWHRVVVFGKLAEICKEYLRKGKQIYIEGRIQTRSWEDKEGNRRYTTEIVANTMQMLGSRSQESTGSYSEQGVPSTGDTVNGELDDIPF